MVFYDYLRYKKLIAITCKHSRLNNVLQLFYVNTVTHGLHGFTIIEFFYRSFSENEFTTVVFEYITISYYRLVPRKCMC